MTDSDRQLVELITQQVLALLQKGDVSRALASSSSSSSSSAFSSPVPHTAPIHPPIGQCTGDYSKFPELAGRLYGTSPQADGGDTIIPTRHAAGASTNPRAIGTSPVQMPASAHAYQPLPLTGFITANQLQEAHKLSPDGTVLLAADARLTPLANDWARQKKNSIRRAAPQEAGSATNTGAVMTASKTTGPGSNDIAARTTGNPWLWWIEGGCPIVRDVTQAFGLALRPIAAAPTSSALPQVLRELARAVKARQVAGGILFVPSGAKAVCMANRCPSLRAIVGTCGEAVEQGLREIGANVLIIEYPHHGHRSTTAMLERFTQQLPAVPASVERMLVDLQRCV